MALNWISIDLLGELRAELLWNGIIDLFWWNGNGIKLKSMMEWKVWEWNEMNGEWMKWNDNKIDEINLRGAVGHAAGA